MATPKTEPDEKKLHGLKWIFGFLADHIIVTMIMCSFVFALIVHWLFSTPAPNEWWVHKWEAGDVLTYVSTIALGLLAVWQNKRFKEENDAAQERMEQLANSANELAVVGKIIECETERLSRLRTMVKQFQDACNTEAISGDLAELAQQPTDFRTTFVHIKMDGREKQVRIYAIELLSELGGYANDAKTIGLIDLVSEYTEQSIALIKDMRSCSLVDEKHSQKTETEKAFIKSSGDFIASRERLLSKVIYGDLTLDQIKALYHVGASEEEA